MTRQGDWIQTYTGRKFWPLDPRPEEVCIEDIAHALGNLCRFGGHCRRFYSVAEHCVYVSLFVAPAFAMAGLLHDASEAYLVDVPKPIKPFLSGYRQAEKRISEAVFDHVGIGGSAGYPEADMREHVKRVDNAILADEALQLMSRPPDKWVLPEKPLGVEIKCWPPDEATAGFMERYKRLQLISELKSIPEDDRHAAN